MEEKIRSELKIINRAFICSEGLPDIQRNLQAKEAELEGLKKKLEDLKLGELEVYQKNYNKTVGELAKDFETMKNFNVGTLTTIIEEFVHSEAEIDKLLQDAIQAKETAEKELNALPDGTQTTTNFKDLEKLVQEIKKDKAKYCKDYSAYEQESRETWTKIHK